MTAHRCLLQRILMFQRCRLSLSCIHFHKFINSRKMHTGMSVLHGPQNTTSLLMCSIDCSGNITTKTPTCKNGYRYLQRRNLFNKIPFLSKDAKVLIKYDGISEKDYTLVYTSALSTMVFWIQTTVSTIIAFGFPSGLWSYLHPSNVPVDPSQFFYFETTTEIVVSLVGLLVLNLSLLVIIHRLPLRIYHSQEKKNFILVYQSVVPWRTWSQECPEGAAKFLGASVWKSIVGSYELKGKRTVISEHRFRFPIYYNKLLGYDNKPLDEDSK